MINGRETTKTLNMSANTQRAKAAKAAQRKSQPQNQPTQPMTSSKDTSTDNPIEIFKDLLTQHEELLVEIKATIQSVLNGEFDRLNDFAEDAIKRSYANYDRRNSILLEKIKSCAIQFRIRDKDENLHQKSIQIWFNVNDQLLYLEALFPENRSKNKATLESLKEKLTTNLTSLSDFPSTISDTLTQMISFHPTEDIRQMIEEFNVRIQELTQ